MPPRGTRLRSTRTRVRFSEETTSSCKKCWRSQTQKNDGTAGTSYRSSLALPITSISISVSLFRTRSPAPIVITFLLYDSASSAGYRAASALPEHELLVFISWIVRYAKECRNCHVGSALCPGSLMTVTAIDYLPVDRITLADCSAPIWFPCSLNQASAVATPAACR